MINSSLRIFSISLVALLVVTSSGLVFGAWYLKQLEDKVTEKFEGRKWVFPSKIYSDSFFLYLGASLRVQDLADKLHRLGYFETQSTPRAKGEYRVAAKEGVIEIYLHDFDSPSERFKGIPVRISLQGGFIGKIENTTVGKEMFSLELEPELITGLYDRIWQERRVVKLDEVPPRAVKTILAIENKCSDDHYASGPNVAMR